MTFAESIQTCFRKYAEFDGRASRSEFWWFTLFILLISMGAQAIGDTLATLVSLGTLLPSIAVTARRLHDIDRSGWWQLIALIPIIGWVILIYWCVLDSTGSNRYG
jgi:uncharacterized membrane protein YhaH (DUF805 family)